MKVSILDAWIGRLGSYPFGKLLRDRLYLDRARARQRLEIDAGALALHRLSIEVDAPVLDSA